MNKIDKRFFYYKTRAAYEEDMDRIPMNAIVFIEDPRCILTHGVEYMYQFTTNDTTAAIGNMLAELFNNKQDKLVAGEGIQINGNVISSDLDLSNLGDDQLGQLVEQIAQAIGDDSDDVYTKELIDSIVTELREEIAASGVDLDSMTQEERDTFTSAVIQMISESQGLDNRYTNAQIDSMLASKQNTLTAGTNISINGNVISSTAAAGLTEAERNQIIQQAANQAANSIDDSYAKKDWVTTQINQHSGGSGSAVPTVNNNTIYFGE